MMKKRLLFVIMLLSSVLILSAWGEVELLDDGKLIDLDKAIEFSMPGADIPHSQSDVPDVPDDPGEPDRPDTPQNRVIVISIRGTTITYNGSVFKGNVTFEQLLRRDNGENVRFELVDDFAEAHVYKGILKILKKLHEEIGLEYSCR